MWNVSVDDEVRRTDRSRRRPWRRSGTQAVDRAALLVSTVVQADEPLTFADLQEACDLPEVHDVADADRPRALRAARARRRRQLRRRQPVLAVRRAGTTPGEDLVRLAAPDAGGDRRGDPRDRQPQRRPRPTASCRSRRSTPASSSAPATGPQIDVPAHCSSLGKVFLAWDVVTLPAGRSSGATDATLARPRRPAGRARRGRRARLGDHRRRARGRAVRHRRPGARPPRPGRRRRSASRARPQRLDRCGSTSSGAAGRATAAGPARRDAPTRPGNTRGGRA